MDPRIPAYHARASEIDWADAKAVLEYQVGAWRLLNGSAHAFDESYIAGLAQQDWHRTANPLTPFNHAGLQDATGWVDRLDEIDVPVLIIHGTDDPVLPYAHGLALTSALRNSRLLTLEGTGHELHPSDWNVMIDAIVEHTSSLPGAAEGNP